MSNITIGSSSWAYNDTTKVGWNASAVYGNSANDLFTFTDGNWASNFISATGGVIKANGVDSTGGNDTVSFAAATSGITFDETQITGANGVSIIGSSLNDQFNWAGSSTITLNGGAGTDTLYLKSTANGTTFTLGNANMTNMEAIAGSTYNDNVVWNGQGTYTFNLGTGIDTLDISSATAGKEINLYDTKYTNIEVVQGSSLADTLRGTSTSETLLGGNGADILYGGDGTDVDSLVGGAGADTFYWTRGYGNDVIVANESVDTLKLTDVALADLSIGSSTAKIIRTTNDVAFNLTKDGANTGITVTAAGTDTIAVAQVALTDSTFNLFAASTNTALSGTSVADLMYGQGTVGTSLNGGLGADTLVGGSGNDTFVYSSSSVFFGQGNTADLIDASASAAGVEINLYDTTKFNGIEYANGSSLADTIRGASTADSLYGGAGADILYGGAGADTLKGGAGADTYWFKASEGDDVIVAGANAEEYKLNASDVVRLSGVNYSDLTFGLTVGNDAEIGFKTATGYTGTLKVEDFADQDVYGSSANVYRVNTFVTDDKTFGLAMGNDNANTLVGTSLDDYVLSVSTANHTVSIDGGAGIDTIYGGAGNDYVKFDATDAIVNGGGGADTLYMAAAGTMDVRDSAVYNGFSVLKGSAGADVIRGGSVNETLVGGEGADDLWGYTGNDVLQGNNGADNYWFTTGDGADTIADDTVSNKLDTVRLAGLAFSDLSFGTANGTDVVIAAGADSLNLANWISYNSDSATANLKRVNTFVTTDKTFGLAIGNDVASTLYGTSMDDFILGGAGNDTLKGFAGVDSLNGGIGNDFFYYSAEDAIFNGGNDIDTLSALTSTAAVELNLYDSKISNMEVLQGSTLGDILRGTDASGESFYGDKGNDQLYGGKGTDLLEGGAGADTYWFGALDGADTITAGTTTDNGSDVVNFYGLTSSQLTFARTGTSDADLKISVNAAQGYTDNLILAGWGSATVANRVSTFVTSDSTFGLAIGTSVNETLTGTSIKDYISAGDGADSINGGLGADTILAGAGDDTVVYFATAASVDGGDGTDSLSAATATAAVEIDLRNADSTKTQYTSIESVTGSSLSDILRGSSSNETLDGGLGADNLWGAAGSDVLTGGAGVDTYWFGAGDGADTISASTTNNTDYVKFYGGIDGNSIQSTVVSGDNLTITLTSGDALTLTDWNKTDGSKLNNFDFGAAGVWGLSIASDGTTATWTKRS